MALEPILESVDSVPEELRSHYVQREGKFVLDVIPKSGYALENIEGLKSALGKERNRADQLDKKIKAFGDLDPSGIQEKLSRLEELQSIDPEKEAGRLAEEKAKSKIEQILNKHNLEKEELSRKTNTYKAKLEQVLVDSNIQKAILEAGGNNKTIDLLLPHVKNQVRLDDNFNLQVFDVVGNPRIGDSQGNPMSLTQLANEFKEKFPETFPGTQQSGGGMPPANRSKGQRPKDISKLTVKQKSELISEIGYAGYRDLISKQGGQLNGYQYYQ